MNMREIMTKLAESQETPVNLFLNELWDTTKGNFFNDRQRMIGNAAVEVSPSIDDRANAIHIHDIQSAELGSGGGREALKMLCDLADKHGVTLEATAKAYVKGRLSTKELLAWYMRYGFVTTGGDARDGYDIVRRGKAQPSSVEAKAPASRDEDGRMVIKLRGFNRKH